jgi:hypothetical protein
VVALWFAAITGWLFITSQPVPDALIAITSAVNTFYFGQVGEERRAQIARGSDDELSAPVMGRLDGRDL